MAKPYSERFASKGLRLGVPDSDNPGEFPLLQNVRGHRTTLVERAGFASRFNTQNSSVKNIATYTQPGNGSPRVLAAVNRQVYLDDGEVVDSGYDSVSIPSMLPFRPSQSPLPWMYISDSQQYRKLSSPDAIDVVTAQNAGIAEPRFQPATVVQDAAAISGALNFIDPSLAWGHSGACSGVTIQNPSGRSTDTIGIVFPDPVSGGSFYTLQVSPAVQYQKEQLVVTDSSVYARVQDVFAPIPAGIKIAGIRYFSGSTGVCVVVPELQPPGPGSQEESIFARQVTANLRRGALVKFSGGNEICYIYDVETGPAGTISFTTSTTSTHTASETLSGVPAIQAFLSAPVSGHTLNSANWAFTMGSGTGSIQNTAFTPNFFTFNGIQYQPDDYVHFSIQIDDLSKLIEMKIIFNVTGNAYTGFDRDTYYYTVRPSDIQAGVQNTLTQLGVAQLYNQRALVDAESHLGGFQHIPSSAQTDPGSNVWSEIVIPLKSFTRTGDDQTKTLNDTTGIQFLFNGTGTANVLLSSITIHGMAQVDVGTGMPYIYRFRGRSSITGARSNPSPSTRYGVSPRRQMVSVHLPSVAYDPQIDLWDVFRMGGSMDSFRLVGTTTVGTNFTDNYADIAVATGEVLEFDNLEPWPTIDAPLSIASGASITGYLASFTSDDAHLATVSRYLPGNLVRLSDNNVYTLQTRPTISGSTVP